MAEEPKLGVFDDDVTLIGKGKPQSTRHAFSSHPKSGKPIKFREYSAKDATSNANTALSVNDHELTGFKD